MIRTSDRDAPPGSLLRLRRGLILLLVLYGVLGTISQKMVPGVDEIFPFFGWSLFSRVTAIDTNYSLLIESHNGRPLDSPVPFLRAPNSMVGGNRYIARKVVQHLGRAQEADDRQAVRQHRRNLERNYLLGEMEYILVEERYQPLEKWRTGKTEATRHLARYSKGER